MTKELCDPCTKMGRTECYMLEARKKGIPLYFLVKNPVREVCPYEVVSEQEVEQINNTFLPSDKIG